MSKQVARLGGACPRWVGVEVTGRRPGSLTAFSSPAVYRATPAAVRVLRLVTTCRLPKKLSKEAADPSAGADLQAQAAHYDLASEKAASPGESSARAAADSAAAQAQSAKEEAVGGLRSAGEKMAEAGESARERAAGGVEAAKEKVQGAK
eukprot:scaffold24.g2963.t1